MLCQFRHRYLVGLKHTANPVAATTTTITSRVRCGRRWRCWILLQQGIDEGQVLFLAVLLLLLLLVLLVLRVPPSV